MGAWEVISKNQMAGDEVIAGMEHGSGEILGDWFASAVKVPEHFIRAPPNKELDDVGVEIGCKEGHGLSCMECASRDFQWKRP